MPPRGPDGGSSRDTAGRPDGGGPDGGGPGPAGPGQPAGSPLAGPAVGTGRAGFAGRINVTIPLATQLGLAGLPGEIPGIGPIDPDPEANTLDRYQTGASADPGIQRINVPDRCRGPVTDVRHVPLTRAATG